MGGEQENESRSALCDQEFAVEWKQSSKTALHHQLLDFAYRPRRVEALGTGLRAIHDGVAAVKAKGILEFIQTLAFGFIPAIYNPAVGLQKRGWPQVAFRIPPVARA